jgi:hypothetical protein
MFVIINSNGIIFIIPTNDNKTDEQNQRINQLFLKNVIII